MECAQFRVPMSAPSIPKLFQSTRVGTANLQHRVVMAPMTRRRANAQHVQGPLDAEYYKQRTSVPGTLAISGGTIIAARAGGFTNIPGIWNEEQIKGWLPVCCYPFVPSRLR
jgi:NADPH2 dehydrogenase